MYKKNIAIIVFLSFIFSSFITPVFCSKAVADEVTTTSEETTEEEQITVEPPSLVFYQHPEGIYIEARNINIDNVVGFTLNGESIDEFCVGMGEVDQFILTTETENPDVFSLLLKFPEEILLNLSGKHTFGLKLADGTQIETPMDLNYDSSLFDGDKAGGPAAPKLVTPAYKATGVPQSNVKFSWNSAGATNYRIVISQNSSFSGFKDLNEKSSCDSSCFTTTTKLTSYNKNMDISGHTYYWKVRANNSQGAIWSDRSEFSTSGSPKVTPLASSYMSGSKIDFGVYINGGIHTGIDILTPNQNPSVYAIADGKVEYNTTSKNYPTNADKYWNAFVVINHGNFYAYYGHLNSSLAVGSKVTKGNPIGTIRNAYNLKTNALWLSNNHLHISITVGKLLNNSWGYQATQAGLSQFVNPKSYIGL
ncbi:MAG: M23 family metallopeptidase [Desulfamplus sp.]|nr:M23 family metallopeptidase [Desulfamplus sp.]